MNWLYPWHVWAVLVAMWTVFACQDLWQHHYSRGAQLDSCAALLFLVVCIVSWKRKWR